MGGYIPKGIFWLKWDFKVGVLVDWQYPDTLEIKGKDLKTVYTNQTYGNITIPRFATFSTEELQIASFFGGRSCTDMAILILDEDENSKEFEIPLVEFFYNFIKAKIEKISTEEKFNEIFGLKSKQDQQDLTQVDFFKRQFNIFFNMFTNFIELIDKRLTQIENLILKSTEQNQK